MRQGLLKVLVKSATMATVALAASTVLGAYLVLKRPVPEPAPPASETLSAEVMNLPQPGQQTGDALVQRPLFWQSRSPYEAPPPEEAKQEPSRPEGPNPLDKVRLLGVFASGSGAGVIIKDDDGRQRLMVGDSIGDWQLGALSPTDATFFSQGEKRVLKLEHALVKAQPPKDDTDQENPEQDRDSNE